ncbi:MAG: NigD-like N-terminal domain-containing protein [Prevotella sp.]|nr:NigD-like N-terminal domain-containing protein [Prevotella sp.]
MRKVFLFLGICLFLSCTTEEYESGDGEMSYLRADFVMAYAGADKSIVSAVTDEGEQLTWSKGFAPKWAEKADTTYRALLYYNKVEGKVDPVSIVSVSVPRIRKMSEVKDKVYTDPVVFESAWKSANNSFINLGLQLKTGTPTAIDAKQVIGMLCDTIIQREDGSKEVALRLYHHQNDVPEYYSANLYVSIPFDRLPCDIQKGDEVSITINTYKGEVKKGFVY